MEKRYSCRKKRCSSDDYVPAKILFYYTLLCLLSFGLIIFSYSLNWGRFGRTHRHMWSRLFIYITLSDIVWSGMSDHILGEVTKT